MAYPHFTGGVDAVSGYGDRWQISHTGTWAEGDYWEAAVTTSTQGTFTLGVGNLHALETVSCFTYRNRVFLALKDSSGANAQFNYSDNDDPTGWEEQNPGAGYISYLSNFGSQDTVKAFSQLQGRLAVLGTRSVQLWTTDADPSNFTLVQTLDNIGTFDPLSVQNLGDFDVLFLDPTGFRSLRAREVTLNAYVDDVGSPVDALVQAIIADNTLYSQGQACGIVDPKTKNYWCFVGNRIFVLSRHPSAKISAWSQYLPVSNDGNTFEPSKFVVYNGRVYVRGKDTTDNLDYLYTYGGTDNKTYDAYSPITFQMPYLDGKSPAVVKQAVNIHAVVAGQWNISLSMDPKSDNFVTVAEQAGTPASPSALKDATYDEGLHKVGGLKGTHFSIKAVSVPAASKTPAKLASIVFSYNEGSKP